MYNSWIWNIQILKRESINPETEMYNLYKKKQHSLKQIPWIENEHLPSIHKTFHGAADIHKWTGLKRPEQTWTVWTFSWTIKNINDNISIPIRAAHINSHGSPRCWRTPDNKMQHWNLLSVRSKNIFFSYFYPQYSQRYSTLKFYREPADCQFLWFSFSMNFPMYFSMA